MAANLPYVVIQNMLQNLIEEGTHASLHTIIDISVNGVLGVGNWTAMRAAMTPPNKARLKAVYTSGHFAHQWAAAGAIPVPPPPPPLHPAEFQNICQCIQCFHYLCRNGIITPGGFRENRQSYLFFAGLLRDRRGDVPLYIVQKMYQIHLLSPQRFAGNVWQPWDTVIGIIAPFERAMKAWIARVKAFHIAANTPLPINYNADMNNLQRASTAYWIDTTTADDLLAWGINLASLPASNSYGTMFHEVIKEQNPHRYAMIRWMQSRTPGGAPYWNYVVPTSLNPAGGIGWFWPPVGVAMFRGDAKAVHVLASLPGANFDILVPRVLLLGVPVQSTGIAATYALTWGALEAFKAWLSYALPSMEAAARQTEILELLRSVLGNCSLKRVAISAEPLPAGTLITNHKKSKTRRRKMLLDVALAFVYTVQELAFHTGTVQPDGTLEVTKMYETSWYRDWVAQIKRDNRNPATRFFRDVVPLIGALDRGQQRSLRSGRDLSDV